MNKLIRCRCLLGLCLLGIIALLPGAAAAATTTLTITSNYGIGLTSVAVKDVITGKSLQSCNFLLKPTAPCVVSNIPVGDTISIVPAPKSGAVVTGGTGSVCTTQASSFQYAATAAAATCNIFAGFPLVVTANGPNVVAATIAKGPSCAIAQPSTGKSCTLAVAPGTVTLTIGLTGGATLTGGTALCAKATSGAFQITIPANGPYACGINSALPSAIPTNGWWWTDTVKTLHYDTGIRYGLQINPTAHALYGVVCTFRADGSAVWYLINATANAQNQTFQGTATEFSNLSGSAKAGAPRPQTIVANVKFTFISPSTGTLTWSPRPSGTPVTTPIERFPISTTVQAPPPLAPVAGLYHPTQNADGPGYFLEMQGPATPHGYIGFFSYTGKGLATWSVTLLNNKVATPFPSKAAQKSWQLSTQFQTYSGGSPITSTPKQPQMNLASTVVATMSPGANAVKLGTGNQTALSIDAGWGLSTSPYWLQIVNNSTTIKTPFVTYFPAPATPNFSFVNQATGASTAFAPFHSYPLSSIANGALLASSTKVNGNLYISDKALQVGNSTGKSTCTALTRANQAAPSPLSNSGDCNLGTRWQFLELGGDYDATYINLFSVPLAFNQGNAAYGNATAAQLAALEVALGNLSGGKAVYPVGSQGKPSFIRAVGPANANGGADPLLTLYPSFSAYIASAFNATTGLPVTPINIANSYTGNTPKLTPVPTTVCVGNKNAAFKAQSYSTSSVKYLANTLTITGTASVVGNFTISAVTPILPTPKGCSGSTGPAKCYSPAVTPAAFSAALYTAVLSYSVTAGNNVCAANQVESNGANDVFSLVVRDLLVSFASGFANSQVQSPPSVPGTTYGKMTSAQWSANAAKLFAGVQPSQPYYNPWGAAVFNSFGNSRIYGFQYSDYFNSVTSPLGNPLMPVQPSVPIQLVIQNGG